MRARRSSRRSSRRPEVARRKPWEARVKSQRKRSASTTRPQRQQRSKATTQKLAHPAARPPATSTKAATSASASAPSASMSSTTSTHDFRNLKEWDTQGTLRKHFFDKVPNCFIDDDMVKGFTEEQLPGKLDKPADYAKWLGLSERFSPAGRVYFNDNFVPYAIKKLTEGFGKEAVAAIKPDLTLAKVQPAVSGIAPTVDPYADAATDGGEDGKDGDTGDAPETSPYLAKVKAQQVTMNKETREHYRQLALKEADQRQLLMLLCGNVEAAMFVDKQGQVRAPQQIIEHTLFLLQPYRMGNTVVGEVMQWVNLSVNIAWKNGYTVVMLVTLAVSILFAIDFLRGLYLMMLRGDSGPSRFFHAAARGTANVLMRIVQYGWSFFCSFFSRKYLPRHRAKQLTQRDYNKWLRILTTTGFFGLCTYVIATYKPDYDKTRRLNLAQYAVQMVRDRYHQVQAMNYLAQLTPGIIGDDVSSGITERQLGLMEAIQKHFIDLDKEVDEMTNDRVSDLFNKFVTGDGELTDYKVDLGLMMMAKFQKSRTSEDTDVQAFRKQLMETYPQEMRCFHFLDAYGHPRNVTDICKVFFIYWKRSRESQLIPTIPHQGGPIAKWFDLTPTKFTPVARSFATQKAKRSSASEELMNTPDHQWWRQHAYLYKSAKNPISLRHVLQEKPASTTASLTPEELQQVKRHPGWTHRISKFTIAALVDKFQLSVNRLEDAYEQHVEVVTKGKGVKGVEWQVSREGMGFGLGTVKEAEAQRLEEEENEEKANEKHDKTLISTAELFYRTLNHLWQAHSVEDIDDATPCPTGYTLLEQSGDGHCFYHSVAYLLTVTPEHTKYSSYSFENVRNDVADYLISHWNLKDLQAYLPQINTRVDMRNYIERIRDTNDWADHVEILAAANVYRCNIVIHQIRDGKWATMTISPNARADFTINLRYTNKNHYDALQDEATTKKVAVAAAAATKIAALYRGRSTRKTNGSANLDHNNFYYFSYDECFDIAKCILNGEELAESIKQKIQELETRCKTSSRKDTIVKGALKALPYEKRSMLEKKGVGATFATFVQFANLGDSGSSASDAGEVASSHTEELLKKAEILLAKTMDEQKTMEEQKLMEEQKRRDDEQNRKLQDLLNDPDAMGCLDEDELEGDFADMQQLYHCIDVGKIRGYLTSYEKIKENIKDMSFFAYVIKTTYIPKLEEPFEGAYREKEFIDSLKEDDIYDKWCEELTTRLSKAPKAMAHFKELVKEATAKN